MISIFLPLSLFTCGVSINTSLRPCLERGDGKVNYLRVKSHHEVAGDSNFCLILNFVEKYGF